MAGASISAAQARSVAARVDRLMLALCVLATLAATAAPLASPRGPDCAPLRCGERAAYDGAGGAGGAAEGTQVVVLWSLPGSGNTWARLLLEHATGVLTGSKYHDGTLAHALPGEMEWVGDEASCRRFSAVKVHPTRDQGRVDGATGRFGEHLCGGRVDKVLVLVRHPLRAMFAEFQRARSRSHVGAVLRTDITLGKWRSRARVMARRWFAPAWARGGRSYADFVGAGGEADRQLPLARRRDVMVARYEDLRDPTRREETLMAMARFLGLCVDAERLRCAFDHADRADTHRPDPAAASTANVSFLDVATAVEAAGERVWDMVGGESWERFNYTRDNYNGP